MQTVASTQYTPTGDMSSAETYTDDQLAAELAAATTSMHASAHNRAGIRYHDAKMRVSIFGAETRRREALVVADAERITADAAPAACTEDRCQDATSHEDTCRCSCDGAGHGINHRAAIQAAQASLRARTVNGFTPGMLAAIDDDEAW